MSDPTPRPERVTLTAEEQRELRDWYLGTEYDDVGLGHTVERIIAAREQALREEVKAELLGELNSEDANAVLYGVTGTHPETYGGVTKDEALECAGELLTRLRALAARIARGGAR